ncbi:MAG: CRISPR-associated helicase Cas3' [Nitrosomonadales bacterium]|nr:CRISPR-associated helicase Cas3' [Nitrosomonadales bacterium]
MADVKDRPGVYFAHSGSQPDYSDWQRLPNHLRAVGDLAGANAVYFSAEPFARLAGLLHDLGKYSPQFKKRLAGANIRVDHATAGAKVAIEKYGQLGKLLAFAIAGHHAGLANGIDVGQGRSTLKERLALVFGNEIPNIDDTWQEINLPEKLPHPPLKMAAGFEGFQCAFFIRMIYSCLVDADYLDTDKFYLGLKGKAPIRSNFPSLTALRDKLNETLVGKRTRALEKSPSEVNELRQQILLHCRSQASLPPGLFSLSVPTGGGKTLTSMAFALDHALQPKKEGGVSAQMRRIIYVIPFTSIIEQNAKEFRKAFKELGETAVLEHHCAFDESKFKQKDSRDKLKLAMENWDAPIIVTTAVQFFESLFADRPSQCRKLHNISGSVIILDEAQILPLKLLRPIMAAINELARNYSCSVVLCTATQPALLKEQGFYNGFDNVRELAPNPPELYRQLKRTRIKHIGAQSDAELQDHLKREQVLLIVNNRRHARALYDSIKALPGARLLTTLLCAKHRSKVLDEIRADLLAEKPCRVISTSLIEAGVDVDFPTVLREECGLDSIAQSAGRCNREGLRELDNSEVLIFQSPEWKMPPELDQLAGSMREVVRNHAGDLLAQEAITRYFQNVYWQKGKELDAKQLLKSHQDHVRSFDFPFQNIASDFRMIESHMLPLIIPYEAEVEELINSLRFADHVGGIARKLQPYLVQVPKHAFTALADAGAIAPIAAEVFGDQFWQLVNIDLYDEDVAGLNWENPIFHRIESLVIT